ncbi:MAG: Maf family protein [bacterium]
MDRRPPFPADFQLIVASQSPRRHSLLRDLGVPFTVVSSTAEEVLGGGPAPVLAERNALAKVRGAVLPVDIAPGAFVLGTDTLVTAGGLVMGKPESAREATQMLSHLSGRTHQVVSGVALQRMSMGGDPAVTEEIRVASALTDVTFVSLQQGDIDAYLASGEWKGKAGAYAIQGLAGSYVSELRGEYSNVVGLPLCLLARMFREAGFDLVRRVWS